MRPYWKSYENWECYKNGMYGDRLDLNIVERCFHLLTDESDCLEAMKDVTIKYPISTKVNFTSKMFNPISWLGQAACNIHCNATARETINAWMSMDKEHQTAANNIAKKVIEEWIENENI